MADQDVAAEKSNFRGSVRFRIHAGDPFVRNKPGNISTAAESSLIAAVEFAVDGAAQPRFSCELATASFPGGNAAAPRLDTGIMAFAAIVAAPVSYTHPRAHQTKANLVSRLLLEKKK